jgi:PAS domain S-box-containing protein
MDGKKLTYEELEKKLAGAEERNHVLRAQIENVRSERDAALLGTRDLKDAYVESERNFRNSLDACPLGIRIVTEEGDLVYANQSILDIYGYRTLKELKEVPKELMLTPESYAQHLERMRKRKAGEPVPPEYEICIRRPDGTIKDLHVIRRPVIWGGKQCYLAMYQDITERKKLLEDREKERKEIRTIFDAAPVLVFHKDKEGKFLRVNRAFAQALNMPEDDFIGKTVFDLYSTDIAQGMTDDDREVFSSGRSKINIIEKYESARGLRWVQTDKVPIFDENGVVTGLIGFAQDITERQRAEEAIKESEEKFSKAFGAAGCAICITSLQDEKFLEVNESYARFTGYTREEVIGRTAAELKLWVYNEELQRLFNILSKEGKFYNQEFSSRHKSGEIRIGLGSAEIINIGGQPHRIVVIADITERKKAEESLKESEEKFYKAFSAAGNAICITSLKDNRFLEINESFTRFTGYSRKEIIGHDAAELKLWVKPEEYQRWMDALQKDGRAYNQEFSSRHKSGEIRVGLGSAEVINIGGQPCRIVIIIDITERKQAEEKHQTILKTAMDGFWMTDLKGKILEANESYCNMVGYTQDELLGMHIKDLEALESPEDVLRHVKKIIRQGSDRFETRHKRKDGSIIDVEVSVDYLNIGGGQMSVFVRDITERKRAEEALKKSEELFRTASQLTSDIVYERDLQTGIATFYSDIDSHLGYELGGYPRTMEGWREHVHPEDLAWIDRQSIDQMEPGVSYTVEYRMRKKDGTYMTWLDRIMMIRDEKTGKPLKFIGAATNITERKKAEQAIAESEAKYHSVFDNSIDAIFLTAPDGTILAANPAACKMFGRSEAEICRMGRKGVIDTSDPRLAPALEQRRQTGEFTGELTLIRSDGTKFPGEISTKVFINPDGTQRTSMIIRDITRRKEAQRAIAESEERFNKAFNASASLMAISTFKEGWIIDANEAYCRLSGYTREELIGNTALAIGIWTNPTQRREFYRMLQEDGRVNNLEVFLRSKNGDTHTLLLSAEKIMLRGEPCLVTSGLDITERKKDEERINHLNLTLRSVRGINQLMPQEKDRDRLIKSVCNILVEGRSRHHAWIALFDESGRPTAWAQTGLRGDFGPVVELFKQGGFPPCAQKALKQKRVVLILDPLSSCVGCPVLADTPNVGGMTIRLEYEGRIYGVLSTCMQKAMVLDKEQSTLFQEVATDIAFALHDIELEAERNILMQESLRAAKLESIGTLAGGIAHDFNNLLTGIMGNIGLAKTYLKPADRTHEMLDEAEKAAVRAKDLTQQLLTFARGGRPVKKRVNIGKLIKESATFALRGSNVRLELDLPDNLWPVEVDEGQISQVIHNLVINADEAMPAGGMLDIKASNFTVKKGDITTLAPGKYVRIDVRDTGVGISEEHLQRIFEPYFTTKQKGSGLGLATVYSIARNHGGYVHAKSAFKEGTTFHIYLPATEKTTRAAGKQSASGRSRAGGRILVMDDDEVIRKMLKQLLNMAGYKAELTVDGAEALKMYAQGREAGKPFNAVIMDLTIPGGMGGKEAIKKLLEIDPEARVIVSSGYATDPIMSEYKKYGFSAVITKPYSVKQLEETLREILKKKRKR